MEGRVLHCPFCGAPLGRRNGELYCEGGATGFAKVVADALIASAPNLAATEGGRSASMFRCPNCANGMHYGVSSLACGTCGTTLPLRLHSLLVEHHSHVAGHEL